jgi:hypothetical protein
MTDTTVELRRPSRLLNVVRGGRQWSLQRAERGGLFTSRLKWQTPQGDEAVCKARA